MINQVFDEASRTDLRQNVTNIVLKALSSLKCRRNPQEPSYRGIRKAGLQMGMKARILLAKTFPTQVKTQP